MLAASSVGTVEYRSIAEPMRAANPRAAFLQGMVQDIDPMARLAEVCIGTPPDLAEGGSAGAEVLGAEEEDGADDELQLGI